MTTARPMRVYWMALVMAIGFVPTVARAQDPRLTARLPEAARAPVAAVLDSARVQGIPTEPIVDRALEGAAKRAPADLIVAAARRLWNELQTARSAFGEAALPGELTAGASALRAGASPADLVELRTRRPEHPLTVAAGVLADLVAVGVPSDTAVAAVLALASVSGDAEYIAFRRNVERDISLGASPAAAVSVRLQAVSGLADAPANQQGSAAGRPPRRRKP